jgi:hypothetical protein
MQYCWLLQYFDNWDQINVPSTYEGVCFIVLCVAIKLMSFDFWRCPFYCFVCRDHKSDQLLLNRNNLTEACEHNNMIVNDGASVISNWHTINVLINILTHERF